MLKRLHDTVMQKRPECLEFVVVSGRMHAVGQEDHDDGPIQIHPERRAREAQVAEGVRRVGAVLERAGVDLHLDVGRCWQRTGLGRTPRQSEQVDDRLGVYLGEV